MSRDQPEEKDLPHKIQPLHKLLKSLYGDKKPASLADLTQAIQLPARTGSTSSENQLERDQLKQSGERFGIYEIKKLLGVGSYGVVYHAVDLEKGLEVALKLPRSDKSFSAATFRRFQREPKFLKKLAHPSIVGLVDTGVINETFFIATEFQHGCDLKEWMDEHRTEIHEDLVVEWGLQLSDALEHACENGVIHRDLKPSNIIVVEIPVEPGTELNIKDRFRPKITDFGLAFSMQEPMSGSTASGAIVGTLGYMAPEQVMSGNNRADIRGDIYALGIILAELALGRPIRKHDNLIDYILNFNQNEEALSLKPIRQVVKTDLYAILHKCVEVNPIRRYQRPQDLNADLRRFKEGISLDLRRSNSRESIRRIVRRHPVFSIAFSLSFVFMIVLIAGLLMHQRGLDRAYTSLELANNEKSIKNKALLAANAEIKENQALIERTAYNSAIRLGFSELRGGRDEAVHDILDTTEKMDRNSDATLREFGWRYLNYLGCRDYRTHLIKDFDLYVTGHDTKKLGQLFKQYQVFCEENNTDIGSLKFYSTGLMIFKHGEQAWLDEQLGASFLWDPVGIKQRYFMVDNRKELLKDSDRPNAIFCTPGADRLYYFSTKDLTAGRNNRNVTIQRSGNRTKFYFNRFEFPKISNDGNVITGICRLKPNSRKFAWVVYDANLDRMIETGFEISEDTPLKLSPHPFEISETGRFAVLFIEAREDILVFDRMNQRLVRIPYPITEPDFDRFTLGIDEERELLVMSDYSAGRIRVWKLGKTEPVAEFPRPIKGVYSIGFLPNGQCFFQLAYSDRIWLWDPLEPKHDPINLDHSDEVWSLSFDSTGQKLVSAGDDNQVRVWDLNTKRDRVIGKFEALVTRGRYSLDESLFAACDYYGNVQVWETKDWKLIKSKKVTDQKLKSLAWSPANDFLVCVGGGNDVIEYRLADDSIKTYPVGDDCSEVIYSAEHDEFVVGVQALLQKKLLFMKIPGGQIVAGLNPGRMPTRFALDPTSDRLAVGFNEGGFAVVSLRDRTIEQMVGTSHADGEVIDLTFTADGRNVITAVGDSRALIFETENWDKVGVMNEHQKKIHAIAISPDGKKLATGDMTGKIKILEIP